MALVTHVLADGQGCRLEYDYDDATLYIRAIRVVNDRVDNVYVSATSTSSGRNYTRTCAPGTTSVSIPTGAAARLALRWGLLGGKLDGVEWALNIPA